MEDKNIIGNPHDLYFKSTFGKPDFIKSFLKKFLPEELIEIIDMDTLSHEPVSYLSEELKEQFADLVYKVNIRGRKAYVAFLFEHKSYKDRMVIFQILKYMVAIWEKCVKDDLEDGKSRGRTFAAKVVEIPIIIPIVVYHGKGRWDIKKALGDMMPGFMKLSENVRKYVPDFKYLLVDLTYFEGDGRINLPEEYSIVLETLGKVRFETKEQVIDIFRRAIDIYTRTKDKDIIAHYIIKTIVYIISTRDDFDEIELKNIADQVSREGGELFMTLAERLMEKGMKEGIEKGKIKERQELAKNLLIDGIEVELIARYTRLSKDEVQKIKREMN